VEPGAEPNIVIHDFGSTFGVASTEYGLEVDTRDCRGRSWRMIGSRHCW